MKCHILKLPVIFLYCNTCVVSSRIVGKKTLQGDDVLYFLFQPRDVTNFTVGGFAPMSPRISSPMHHGGGGEPHTPLGAKPRPLTGHRSGERVNSVFVLLQVLHEEVEVVVVEVVVVEVVVGEEEEEWGVAEDEETTS